MRADNTAHLITAAHTRRQRTHAKAVQALREIDAAGTPVTFEAVARAAGVSRSWLYGQPELRGEIERLREARRRAPDQPVPARQRASETSLLRRLEAANERNRHLTDENRQLREQLARALGEDRAGPTVGAVGTGRGLLSCHRHQGLRSRPHTPPRTRAVSPKAGREG